MSKSYVHVILVYCAMCGKPYLRPNFRKFSRRTGRKLAYELKIRPLQSVTCSVKCSKKYTKKKTCAHDADIPLYFESRRKSK